MIEATRKARCAGCSRTYRLPAARRSAACPTCGGAVRPLESAHSTSKEPATGSQGPGAEGERERRRAAADELQRAQRWVKTLRWFYALAAFAAFLYLALSINALRDPAIEPARTLPYIGLQTLVLALFVVGSIQVVFYPFFWSVVVAAMSALAHGVAYALGAYGSSSSWSLIAPLAATLLLASPVLPTLRLRRLLAGHPDLREAQPVRALPGKRGPGTSAAKDAARMRIWRLGVGAGLGVIALSIVSSYQVYAHARPPILSAAVADFRSAWNASRPDVVAAFLAAPAADSPAELLAKAARRGWGTTLPVIGEGSLRQSSTSAANSTYPLHPGRAGGSRAGEQLSARWILRDNRWQVDELALPAPPTRAIVERFASAWNSSDLGAVAGLGGTERAEPLLAQLEELRERRAWNAALPTLATPVAEVGTDRAEVEFAADGGFLSATFALEADRWHLIGIRPPASTQ